MGKAEFSWPDLVVTGGGYDSELCSDDTKFIIPRWQSENYQISNQNLKREDLNLIPL